MRPIGRTHEGGLMNSTWKRVTIGAALATALFGAVAIPAAAADADDGRLFTGHGTGLRPPQALMRAEAQAEFFASGAGYGHCEPFGCTGAM